MPESARKEHGAVGERGVQVQDHWTVEGTLFRSAANCNELTQEFDLNL